MWEEEGESICDAHRERLPRAKVMRRKLEGSEEGVSIPTLGNMAIKEEWRETYCQRTLMVLRFQSPEV